MEMNKDVHEDSRESFDIHPQQPQVGHSVLHPGLSRPLPAPLQQSIPRPQQQNSHHPSKETRPSVIESSQPHIIECT